MTKTTIKQSVTLFSVLMILTSVPVFASAPAPTPVCSIAGIIKSVEFKDAYDEPCLKDPYGCPTDMELQHPARYFLDVSINSVTYVIGDTSFNTCQNMYPIGSVQKIFINKDKVKSGDKFVAGQGIDGVVRSFWGKSFDSYTLLNIIEPSKISEKLLQQNYVDKVSNVSLQSDQRIYSVQGTKKGKLFFFIPVTLNIKLEINATTGAVKEIKKPWWSFLVRSPSKAIPMPIETPTPTFTPLIHQETLPLGKGIFQTVHYKNRVNNPDVNIENPYLNISEVSYTWAELEPQEGNYQWTELDNYISTWQAKGKKVIVSIDLYTNGGANPTSAQAVPQWVFDAGATKITTKRGILFKLNGIQKIYF